VLLKGNTPVAEFTNYELNFTILSMAILASGLKSVRTSANVTLDNQSSIELPKGTEENINSLLKFLPAEHLAGLDKIRLVDFIKPPQMKGVNVPIKGDLPGLYHPKVQNTKAYIEISAGALLQPTEGFAKRLMAKQGFKGNLAGVLFSLVGQHYYLTLRHSVKKTNLEPQIRQYAEKNLKAWGQTQNQNSFRTKLFKPFQPLFERLAKWLNKKQMQAMKSGK
jgi:hypothetical protein